MIRKSKLSPQLFLDMMFYSISSELKSLNQMSQNVTSEHFLSISKQGIDERFSQESVDFAKELLKESISSQVCSSIDDSELQLFNTVRIKDSTTFELHESLAKEFEGFGKGGGPNSKSAVSIQYEFDIKKNQIFDIDISSATKHDSIDAIEKKEELEKHDLIIRDLGYYSGEIIDHYIGKEIYFISKLFHNVSVRLNKEDEQKVNFKELYTRMIKGKLNHLDLNVFIGKKKQPVRLIAVLMPDDVYEKRIRRRNKENKSLGYTISDEYKYRAHFNLFICNITESDCTWEQICKLYKIRWQIELVFKSWKSIMNIDEFRKMNIYRFKTTLYLKLLWIIINWKIVADCKNVFYKIHSKLLSTYKCFQTLKEMSFDLRKSLLKAKTKIENTILNIISNLEQKHWVEKRKKRCNIEEIFDLIFCKSNNNSYI